MNPTILLTNPDQSPDDNLFKEILNSELYQTYKEYENKISNLDLTPEWRNYHDGKAWLCKITLKKKTIAWLSL